MSHRVIDIVHQAAASRNLRAKASLSQRQLLFSVPNSTELHLFRRTKLVELAFQIHYSRNPIFSTGFN
ncbi:hypothetical protein V6N13_086931 [Hibiscus sabdariffa]